MSDSAQVVHRKTSHWLNEHPEDSLISSTEYERREILNEWLLLKAKKKSEI